MSTFLGEVEIPNRATGLAETGAVWQGLEARHLEDFERVWWPLLKTKRAELIDQLKDGIISKEEFEATFVRLSLQDHHWDWTQKHVFYASDPKNQFFALDADNQTQGLMMTAVGQQCRLPNQIGRGLVYIEYLAVAPWNRKHFMNEQKYGHIGSLLIATAVSQSIDLSYDGSIGLHSLPQADGFYRYCGMEDLGPDPSKQDMLYFEMGPARAKDFLERQ
ncbi:MAG: hypothetical protein AAF357_08050 [Verrucomicrobiota bacterium]